MSGTRLLERLSAADHYSLLGDDFGWPWDIGVVAVAEGAGLLDGNGELRIDAVRRRVEPRLHLVPRFRQVLYRPSFGLGWPVWADAQRFNVADHVRVFPLPAPAGEAQLLAACEQLRGQRLDPGPAAVAAVAAARLARAAGGPVRADASRHRRWRRRGGCPGGAARPCCRCADAGGTAVDAGADASGGRAFPRQHAVAPAGTRPHPVTSGPPGEHGAPAAVNWPAWREVFAEERAPRTSLNRRSAATAEAGPRPQPPGAGQADRPRPRRQGQ